MPAAPARERARGFDDAAILARLVARECPHARIAECLAGRRPAAGPPVAQERTADPPRVALRNSSLVLLQENIWLVDDVATTGATLLACADVLKQRGAERVRALTFARADN